MTKGTTNMAIVEKQDEQVDFDTYELDDLVDKYWDAANIYKEFCEHATCHSDGTVECDLNADDFFDDLIEYVNGELPRYLNEAEAKYVCREFERQWAEKEEDMCDSALEWHDDDGWPY